MTESAIDLVGQLHRRFHEIRGAPIVELAGPHGESVFVAPNRQALDHFQGALQRLTHLADVMERDYAEYQARKDADA
jgi:hypothetical protein